MSKLEEQRKGFGGEAVKFICIMESCTKKDILVNAGSHGYLQIITQFLKHKTLFAVLLPDR